MQLALIGIPGTGVKTIFSAITGHAEAASAYTSGSGQSRIETLKIPDDRLDLISKVYSPKKTTPATVEMTEFPGLFGARGGDNRAVGQARIADALVLVIRSFESQMAPHALGQVSPERDLDILQSEMAVADLTILEPRLDRLEKQIHRSKDDEDIAEQEVLRKCKEVLEAGGAIRNLSLSEEDRKRVRSFQFLTEKPIILILNIGEDQLGSEEEIKLPFSHDYEVEALCGSLEAELAQLEEEERAEFMQDFGVTELAAPAVLAAAYRKLEIVTFFTYGEDECRAWHVRKGDTAVIAAGKIHTDLARGFIRAEVVGFNDFKEHGDVKGAKAAGKFRLESRDYLVEEGDLIIIRHNA